MLVGRVDVKETGLFSRQGLHGAKVPYNKIRSKVKSRGECGGNTISISWFLDFILADVFRRADYKSRRLKESVVVTLCRYVYSKPVSHSGLYKSKSTFWEKGSKAFV